MNEFLEFLSISPIYQRKILVLTLTDQQLKLLTEIIYNAAMDNIPISEEDKRKLTKYKLGIRKALAEGLSKKQRRKRLLNISSVIPVFIQNYLQWQRN